MALRAERRRHALRGPALASRSAIALTAGRTPDRQCRDGHRLSRTTTAASAVARGDRRRPAPYRLAGAHAAAPPRPADRDAAGRMGIMAPPRRQTPPRREKAPKGAAAGGRA